MLCFNIVEYNLRKKRLTTIINVNPHSKILNIRKFFQAKRFIKNVKINMFDVYELFRHN